MVLTYLGGKGIWALGAKSYLKVGFIYKEIKTFRRIVTNKSRLPNNFRSDGSIITKLHKFQARREHEILIDFTVLNVLNLIKV